jgi:hypothetical protein
MRVGVRASVVGARRIDSVARTAAQMIREANSSGDHQALGRFLRSFTGISRCPAARPIPAKPRPACEGEALPRPARRRH